MFFKPTSGDKSESPFLLQPELIFNLELLTTNQPRKTLEITFHLPTSLRISQQTPEPRLKIIFK